MKTRGWITRSAWECGGKRSATRFLELPVPEAKRRARFAPSPGSIFVGNLNYLFIRPSPHLLGLAQFRDRLVLTSSAVPGWTYCLEYTDTLGRAWRESPSGCVTARESFVSLTNLTAGMLGQRFYRIVERP